MVVVSHLFFFFQINSKFNIVLNNGSGAQSGDITGITGVL